MTAARRSPPVVGLPALLAGWCALLWVLALPLSALAKTVSVLDASVSEVNLGRELELLEDPTGKLSLTQAIQKPHWQMSTSDEPNMGFTSSAWWARTRLTVAKFDQRTWYLQVNDAILNQIDVYFVLPGNRIIHKRGGGATPTALRDVPYRTHVFEFPDYDRNREMTIDVYLRVASQLAVVIPAQVFDAKTFSQINTQETWIYSLYFGFMLSMLFFNVVVWLIMKDTTNLLYCGFSAGILLVTLVFSGFGKQFIWPESTTPDNIVFILSVAWTASLAVIFSSRFLHTESATVEPLQKQRLYLSCILSGVAIIAASLGSPEWGIQIAVATCIYSVTSVSFSAIFGIVQKNKNAALFSIAWASFIAGTIIFSLRGFGFLPSNIFTTNILQISSVLECFLLMIALIEKSRKHREDAELATTRAMILLEEKVEQRTTELARTQEKLIHSEKMAALGVFTAGMAHEINNPANFVSAGVQNADAITDRFEGFVHDLLDDDADEEIQSSFQGHFEKLRSQHRLIHTGIDRITTIIAKLRASQPEGDTGMMPVNLSEVCESAWALMERQLKQPLTFQPETVGEISIAGLAADLQQALLALFGNAVFAIEDRRATENNAYQGFVGCRIERDTAETVTVTVSDNGIGVKPYQLGKVFDPFFTTREVGKGAGLGLSMTRDIVERHGGTIRMESEPGQGARVIMTFPLTSPAVA